MNFEVYHGKYCDGKTRQPSDLYKRKVSLTHCDLHRGSLEGVLNDPGPSDDYYFELVFVSH